MLRFVPLLLLLCIILGYFIFALTVRNIKQILRKYCPKTGRKGGVISMTTEIDKEPKRHGIIVNSVPPGGMWTPGCLSNGPVKSLIPEKQAEIGKEMMVAKLDATPFTDSVAVVVYAMYTHMANGITGETVVADSGMMRNIMFYQPAIEECHG